ncbi:MAG: hypothetical protein C0452_03935 [Pseudomonas sp.]|nr:hypothetical protein [Pseudomonas sp.]MBA4243049.1 hypothetical protein [Pseudomonas sp.]
MSNKLADMLGELIDQRDSWERREQPHLPTGEIDIAAWVKITGIGLGKHGQYQITENGVSFKGWATQQIAEAPVWQQPDMLAENEHRLTFPCTPQQLLDFVRGDVSGCLSSVEQSVEALISSEPTLVEARIGQILASCKKLGYAPLNIPYGGKTAIKSLCLATPKQFTAATFDKAWKVATSSGRVRMADSDKYAGRGK